MATGTITGRFSASSLLSEDDLVRLRMGRLIRCEEIEGRQLVYFSGKARFLRHLLGLGVDWTRPAVRSSRPLTADGRQSFVFSHRTVSKRRWLTAGQTPSSKPVLRGVGPGTAKKFSAYIRRAEALEKHEGRATIAGSAEAFRPDFWDAVEARERADGRIQSRIVAELPYEDDVGPEGRRRILQRLGEELDDLGLPWMGAVHRPDAHSDRRNYHLHLIYHDRFAVETLEGGLLFARKKCPDCRDRGFIPRLRKRYAALVNDELERAGLDRRWDPRRYDQMGITKEPGEHLGVKAAALERKGVATQVGSRNVAREFAYRMRLAEQDAATIASETLKTLERTKIVGKYITHGDVPRELMNATEAFVQAAIIYADWRSLEASRLIKLSLAQWLQEAMPSRLIQVARTDRAESETARQMSDHLLWHLENRVEVLTDALDRMRLNARQARDQLTQAERRFKDESLLHLLGRCRNRITHLRQRLATADGKLTEVQWADKRRSLSNLHASMTTTFHNLRHELADTLLPQLFCGKELAALQHALHSLDGVKRVDRTLLDLFPTADGPAVTAAIRAMSTTSTMISVSESALEARKRLERMNEVDTERDLRNQTVFDAHARANLEALLRMDTKILADLERGIRARPSLWRVAEHRGLAAPLDDALSAPETGPARRRPTPLPDSIMAGRAGHTTKHIPTRPQQQPPADQPTVERTAESDRPTDDPVVPLKLQKGEDAKPLLAGKSNEELLAMRKVTLEELKAQRRQIGEWATAQKDMLQQGLRALDTRLAERGVETATQPRRLTRQNRGGEL